MGVVLARISRAGSLFALRKCFTPGTSLVRARPREIMCKLAQHPFAIPSNIARKGCDTLYASRLFNAWLLVPESDLSCLSFVKHGIATRGEEYEPLFNTELMTMETVKPHCRPSTSKLPVKSIVEFNTRTVDLILRLKHAPR